MLRHRPHDRASANGIPAGACHAGRPAAGHRRRARPRVGNGRDYAGGRPGAIHRVMGSDSHLDDLNPAQREAATFGVAEGGPAAPAPPLLVVAGAGTGKTGTLAHRVAHLVARRRRPAAASCCSPSPAARPRRWPAAPAGSAAARSASDAPLEPGVGRHLPRDRRPPAAPVRARDRARPGLHRPGPRRRGRPDRPGPRTSSASPATDRRFPRKATCLAIYSAAVNTARPLDDVLAAPSRGAPSGTPSSGACSRAYVAAKQRAERARLRRPAAVVGASCWRCPSSRPTSGGRFDHVLVDEYQDTNALQARDPQRAEAGRARRHGGRRRRAGDLLVPRAPPCATSWTSRALFEPAARSCAGAQLPLDAADPRRGERGDGARGRAVRADAGGGRRLHLSGPEKLLDTGRRCPSALPSLDFHHGGVLESTSD